MIPLYGFLHGDTLGLLLLVDPDATMDNLANLLQRSADVRVRPGAPMRVVYKGQVLAAGLTVRQASIKPLERVDVVPEARDVA